MKVSRKPEWSEKSKGSSKELPVILAFKIHAEKEHLRKGPAEQPEREEDHQRKELSQNSKERVFQGGSG